MAIARVMLMAIMKVNQLHYSLTMHRFRLKFIALSSLVALIAIGIIFSFSTSKTGFPYFQPGVYAGRLIFDKGIRDGDSELALFAIKDEESSTVSFAVGDSTWQIGQASNAVGASSAPLKISHESVEYIFFGNSKDTKSYKGIIENAEQDKVGNWELSSIPNSSADMNSTDSKILGDFLKLSAMLEDIENQIKIQSLTVEQQKSEIERLGHYLTEGKSLRENADKKFRDKKDQLDELNAIKSAKQKEAAQIRSKFEISQRLGGMGKLVYLSRNSLELERQWYESMYDSSPLGITSEFDNLVARAERIITLKKEIRAELEARGN